MKIEIVPASESHRPFVTDAFVRKFSRTPQAAGVSGTVLASLLEPLLNEWQALIAAPQDDPDTYLGFVLFEEKRRDRPNPVVAYVYVVEEWQRHGIARALLTAAGVKAGTKAAPLEVHSPFNAQRICEGGPAVSALCDAKGLTFRWRPYLPLQVQLDSMGRAA